MRRSRQAFAAPLALFAALVALVGAAPRATPASAQETPPSFRLMPPRDGGPGPAPGGPPLVSADAPEGAPAIALPSGQGGAPAPVVTAPLQVNPRNDAKLGGLSPEAARRLTFGPARPALSALSAACEPMISNSLIYGEQQEGGGYTIYNWSVITSTVNVESDIYYSYPYSLGMRDGDEPEADGRPNADRDEDWFGQDFYFPADGKSMLIRFNVYYPAAGDVGFDSVDYGYVELYRVDEQGNLIDEIPGTQFMEGFVIRRIDPTVDGDPDYEANTWYSFTYFFDQTRNTGIPWPAGQRVALVFDQDGDRAPPFEQPYIDNPQVTVCPTATEPRKAVSGYVEVQGLPLSNEQNTSITTASLGLLYRESAGASPELVRVTNPDEFGYYAFIGLPDLPPGGSYQVIYLNSGYETEPPEDGGPRLAYYAGPLVDTFPTPYQGYDYGWSGIIDIADIALAGPAHYAEVAGDVTFSWDPRPVDDDQGYLLCFYDPDTLAESCSDKLITGASATVNAAALDAIAGFPFALGKTLGWYVQVVGFGHDAASAAFDGIGASRFSQFVTFVEQADTPPPPPAKEDKPPPPADPGAESWTLLFYLAGDDEELTAPAGNARGMVDILSNLNQLTDRFPNVNIVVQFDFYERLVGEPPASNLPTEIRGTRRCYLQADRPALADACRQLGELNTGEPQPLTDFIVEGITSRPADHVALIIMGHGNGVSGVAGDRTGADDALRPWELERALRDAKAATGRQLDLVVFYACLMGNFETAALVAPFADYMVASPNIATLVDINAQILELAGAGAAPRALAAGIVEAYNGALRSYNGFYGRSLSIAMAAFDLTRVAAVKPLVSALGAALAANLSLNDVGAARGRVQLYDSSAPDLWGFTAEEEDALVDLRHLATLLAASANTEVRAAATALLAGLGEVGAPGGLVVARAASSGTADLRAGGSHNLANSSGLSIFFPTGSSAGNQSTLTRNYLLYYRQTSFRTGSWDELVDATRTGIPSLPRGVRLGGLAGAGGSTLQNLGAPELFPSLSAMPRAVVVDPTGQFFRLRLPLLRR